MKIIYTPTTDLVADLLTKPLKRVLLQKFTLALGIHKDPPLQGYSLLTS